LPVISVGNLSIGGTGKTPMIEWLIERFAKHLDLAILSRGYKRKTKGYRKVNGNEKASEVGDESLQLKRKYPFAAVAVSESRTLGLSSLLMDYPSTQVVLLDDAFQHRSIRPGLNILLTEYKNPFFHDYIMPVGTLREWRSASSRANIVIVTKCPESISEEEVKNFKAELNTFSNEDIFFSTITYRRCYSFLDYQRVLNLQDKDALLIVTALASPAYLSEYLENKVRKIYSYEFSDHYHYTERDVENIINSYNRIPYERKALVTTEKDIVKLLDHRSLIEEEGIEIFIQRIGVNILFGQSTLLEARIKDFLLNFRR